MIGGLVARHTIIRERPEFVSNGGGGQELDFSQATQVEIPGWAIDAGGSSSDRENRDGAVVQMTLRGPYDADVERHDRIVVDGQRYLIDGDVVRQSGVTSFTSHTVLALVKWDG